MLHETWPSRLPAEPNRAQDQHRCYQPIGREHVRITLNQILEVLADCEHPVTIVTKSALIERDLILGPMAQKNLVKVFVSIRHPRPRLAHGARRGRSPLYPGSTF